jgi:hypothetical protein
MISGFMIAALHMNHNYQLCSTQYAGVSLSNDIGASVRRSHLLATEPLFLAGIYFHAQFLVVIATMSYLS